MYVIQVGVQKIEQMTHHNEVWYGRIPDCWLVCKHAMEEEDTRDRSFKMRRRLFKTSSRMPQARTMLHCNGCWYAVNVWDDGATGRSGDLDALRRYTGTRDSGEKGDGRYR
jgi:hypothetical protein